MRNQKVLEVAGKRYTITANRSIINTIADICPEFLSLDGNSRSKKGNSFNEETFGRRIYSKLDVLFYDMIKIAHPEITKEKSDEILELAEDEYNEFDNRLLELAMTPFESSIPSTSKKNLNW